MSAETIPAAKKAKGQLTVQQRIEVFELRDQHWSHRRIAAHFGVSQAAISKILRYNTKEKLQRAIAANSNAKRTRAVPFPQAEEAVLASTNSCFNVCLLAPQCFNHLLNLGA